MIVILMQNAGSGCLSTWVDECDTSIDYGVFSLVFLHKDRLQPLFIQGAFHYFPKKILSAPAGRAVFSREIP